MTHADQDAQALRREIDLVNEALLALLSRRGELVRRLACLSRAGQAPEGRDAHREAAMLQALKASNPGPYSEQEVQAIFQAIFDASLALKTRTR